LWFALHQAVNREVKSCSAVAAITSGLLKTIVSAAQTPSRNLSISILGIHSLAVRGQTDDAPFD
jgi:hypothetical protein